MKKAALGRGLSALIADADTTMLHAEQKKSSFREEPKDFNGDSGIEIDLDAIEANSKQPRQYFNNDALQELAESIKNLGVIQPITVRKIKQGKYQIISGERRYRASRIAGLATIPAFVRSTDDEDVLTLALVENIQREDLNAIEVAISYQRLMNECSLTQEEMSKRVGKQRSTVANYLRLLNQPAEIQAALRERKISMGHARAIAGLPESKDQMKIFRKILDKGLSVRQVEDMVKKMSEPPTAKKALPDLPNDYMLLIEKLEHYFNSNIAIKRSEKGGGSITIHFADDKEINDFLNRLK